MSTHLVLLRDIRSKRNEYFDVQTGAVYADPEGVRKLRTMVPTDIILGERGEPIRDSANGLIHSAALCNIAAEHWARRAAMSTGQAQDFHTQSFAGSPTQMRALPDGRVHALRDADGKLVKMDLAITDVHTPATLPTYVGGYHIADGVADVASPVIMTPHQRDVYFTWNATTDFNRANPTAASAGGEVSEVNPGLASTTFSAPNYALGGFLPTEVQSNADAPLQPFAKMVQVIVDRLRLEREYRVATLLETSGNWNSNMVTTLAANSQWNGGSASDPVANLHHVLDETLMEDNLRIIMSAQCLRAFLRNAAVQKFIGFKDSTKGIPSAQEIADALGLPPIYAARMKYFSGGAPTYVWGNHCIVVRVPSQSPPTNQIEIGTSYTMRWNGGPTADGNIASGFLVRTFFDQKRGSRGGTKVVVTHNDSEQMTSGYVGGAIFNALQ